MSPCLQVSVSEPRLCPQTLSSVEAVVSTVTVSRDRPAGSALADSDVQNLPVHLRRCSGRSVTLCLFVLDVLDV